jgi:hypothetical protein
VDAVLDPHRLSAVLDDQILAELIASVHLEHETTEVADAALSLAHQRSALTANPRQIGDRRSGRARLLTPPGTAFGVRLFLLRGLLDGRIAWRRFLRRNLGWRQLGCWDFGGSQLSAGWLHRKLRFGACGWIGIAGATRAFERQSARHLERRESSAAVLSRDGGMLPE